jgi:hypothetical protein
MNGQNEQDLTDLPTLIIVGKSGAYHSGASL